MSTLFDLEYLDHWRFFSLADSPRAVLRDDRFEP